MIGTEAVRSVLRDLARENRSRPFCFAGEVCKFFFKFNGKTMKCLIRDQTRFAFKKYHPGCSIQNELKGSKAGFRLDLGRVEVELERVC